MLVSPGACKCDYNVIYFPAQMLFCFSFSKNINILDNETISDVKNSF